MKKAAFIFATILAAFFVNTNCTLLTQTDPEKSAANTYVSSADKNNSEEKEETSAKEDLAYHNYGAYLAGRVANMRLDLNKAADYYMIASQTAPQDMMLTNRIYLMLTAEGRIPEAAKYAEIARSQGDKNPLINLIISINHSMNKRYHQAIAEMDNLGNTPMQNMITAWNYAALLQEKSALDALSPMKKNKVLLPLYYFQAGAISDFLGNKQNADKYYQKTGNFNKGNLAIFPLQVISNFYIRNGEPDKAITLIKKSSLSQDSKIKDLLNKIVSEGKDAAPILSSAEIGLSDALFEVGILHEQGTNESEVAIFFATLAGYVNPDYSLPFLFIGSTMEKKELWQQAIQAYQKVKPDDFVYYSAQIKAGQNFLKNQQPEKAEQVFRNLLNISDDKTEAYTNLAEALRLAMKYTEAIHYYQLAIESIDDKNPVVIAPLNMAIGICYGAIGNNIKAEEYLRKVLAVSQISIIQNHLGYILLQQNKNIEEAFDLIISAYNKTPTEGTIVDSLGWAFYKIGKYDEAVKYLEAAIDLTSTEAVIYDHLGDAYWQSGRKDEAVFQWNHAIALQDSSGELNKETVKEKIRNGLKAPVPLSYDKQKIEAIVQKIKTKPAVATKKQ